MQNSVFIRMRLKKMKETGLWHFIQIIQTRPHCVTYKKEEHLGKTKLLKTTLKLEILVELSKFVQIYILESSILSSFVY